MVKSLQKLNVVCLLPVTMNSLADSTGTFSPFLLPFQIEHRKNFPLELYKLNKKAREKYLVDCSLQNWYSENQKYRIVIIFLKVSFLYHEVPWWYRW